MLERKHLCKYPGILILNTINGIVHVAASEIISIQLEIGKPDSFGSDLQPGVGYAFVNVRDMPIMHVIELSDDHDRDFNTYLSAWSHERRH